MVTKTLKQINAVSLLMVCALFPFGQVPSLLFQLTTGIYKTVQAIDFFVLLFVITYFLGKNNLQAVKNNKKLIYILSALSFSFILGIALGYFSLTSALYLLRIVVYLLFAFSASVSINVLIVLGGISALFGIMQYFLLPDVRFLKALGWDDHYFRLVGTFFDPAYIGVILVLTLLLSLKKLKSGLIKYSFLLFLFVSILLTYSRASFLSLIIGILAMIVGTSRNILKFTIFIGVFVFAIFLLPRPSSEGVKLERTFSIFLRVKNYRETLTLWKSSPLFGIGYNNICEARGKILNTKSQSLISHSCSGADNSLLVILTTTGFIGFALFLSSLIDLYKKIPAKEKMLFIGVTIATFIHSAFSNTLFYPWVIIWLTLYIKGVLSTRSN